MARNFRLNRKITFDLDRILSVAAIENGVRLTFINGEQQLIAPIPSAERDRLFDCWLGIREARPRKAGVG
jgi:hypothetical protein